MTVMDDFVAEAVRLQGILGLLTRTQWRAESGAGGWSVADVVLHLAQSDEAVAASADGGDHRRDVAAAGTVDGWAARMVDAEPAPRPGRLRLACHRPARRHRPARSQDLRVTPGQGETPGPVRDKRSFSSERSEATHLTSTDPLPLQGDRRWAGRPGVRRSPHDGPNGSTAGDSG
jgi:Mycothiol maleylpyruvate isomerase N-terminal domain